MTTVFTICSNNYLAQAKTLMDSIHKHNLSFNLVIGLSDELNPNIDYSFFSPAEIIPVNEIDLDDIDDLILRYDIIEFNTSIKPSFFKFLLNRNTNIENIIYLDPDIKVYSSLESLVNQLKTHSILLTPHIYNPIDLDLKKPNEQTFQLHGIYNLGFLGLNVKKKQTLMLLDWWEERCLKLCVRKPSEGVFVDQSWINFVPSYFSETCILRNFGYNMAPWNLHERRIVHENQNNYLLNDSNNLVFYHFSSYNFKEPEKLNRPFYNRFDFNNRPDLKSLYEEYRNDLIKNKIDEFSNITYAFIKPIPEPVEIKEHKLFKKILKQLTPPIIYDSLSKLKRNINV